MYNNTLGYQNSVNKIGPEDSLGCQIQNLERVSIVLQHAPRYDMLGELITSQPFTAEFTSMGCGWICQEREGKIAACSMSSVVTTEELIAHLMRWCRQNLFQQRLIVLVARHLTTSAASFAQLRSINRVIRTVFHRKVRVCLVTKDDILYIRGSLLDVPPAEYRGKT